VRIQYQNLAVFNKPLDELLSALSEAGDGIVDLQPHIFNFTLATTTDLLFGEPVRRLEREVQTEFAKNFDYTSSICAVRIRLADLNWLYRPKKFRDACEVVKRYADHFVTRALKDREENGQEAALEKHPFILDLYEVMGDAALVRDQLIHVLIAGRDTTACLISWAM